MKLPKLWAPNLVNLYLSSCENLAKLSKLWAPNLKRLNLYKCENLVRLPKLWAPNLKSLDLVFCRNLAEIHEYFGALEKLEYWFLSRCKNLQILPSQLRLKSLEFFVLSDCSRLEKLPNFHPEMKCLKNLYLYGSGIREVPSSIEHLTNLEKLSLFSCENLRDLPDSICKLQRLWELWTSTTKLRQTCNSSGYQKNKEIELDLLMMPDYFPELRTLHLSETNIVTIPKSISRFPKYCYLYITNCKLLREIQGLPRWMRIDREENCMLLDTQSASGLLNQVSLFL